MINKRMIRFISGMLLLLLFISIPFISTVQQYISIPHQQTVFNLEDLQSSEAFSAKKDMTTTNELLPNDFEAMYVHKNDIPVKKVDVSVLENKKIIPGGQSIGIQLHDEGMFVIGFHQVVHDGKQYMPGENADIEIGDMIISLNGEKIKKLTDVKRIVREAGKQKKPIDVQLKRNDQMLETKITPRYSSKDKAFQIGLYIRDATTGIGTVSFYEEDSGKYGALGHMIADPDTKKPITVHDGKIVNAKVTGIEKGSEGVPGEKQAQFSLSGKKVGTITKNNPFGIFGVLEPDKLPKPQGEPIDIGLADEIEKGPAHILTVVEGNKIEKFAVEIVNHTPKKFPATKGIIVKVTDKELLDKTGGIVQGMSGSPIIQNGKLIGAITHVFVNDPTSGYGVHVEWMLQEADIYSFSPASLQEAS